MATDTPRIPEQGVATLPDEAWERARRRAEIISPLAQSETVGHEAADIKNCECRRAIPWPYGSLALTRARSSAGGKARMPLVTYKVWAASLLP